MAIVRENFIGQDPHNVPDIIGRDLKQMQPIYEINFSSFLPQDRSAPILDFGCGYGTFLRYLESSGHSNLRGFDPDSRCASFCRTQVNAPIDESKDPFRYLSDVSTPFQMLTLLNVLNYFERDRLPAWFLACYRALKPGGILLIDVPNSAGLTGFTDFIQDPYMKSVYTDVLLRDLLVGAGFEVVKLEGLRIPAKGLKRFAWKSMRAVWFSILKTIYLLERGRSDRNPCVLDYRIVAVARRPL